MQPILATKAVLYCRVSSKEQEDTGYSLDAQEKLLREYAQKTNLDVVQMYKISESASGRQVRKTFQEMMRYVGQHRIAAIVCEKIDRLTRNLKDASMICDWISDDERRSVHFVKESFVVNKNTRAHENLVWDMKVAIARFYTNNLSEEVKKGQKEKLAQGWLPTKPPPGYKTIGEKGHKTHVIDETVAPAIKKMFEWYSTGTYSLARLEKELYESGFRTRNGMKLSLSRIHDLLTDPFYCGKMRWKGRIYPGNQEPLIGKDLFDRVQTLLHRKINHPYFRKHNPVFKSLIHCKSCSGLVTWYFKKGHWYGHCNNHGEYRKCLMKTCVREDRLEDQLLAYLERLAPKSEEVLQWIVDIIKQTHEDHVDRREQEIHRVTTHLGQARKRKDRLYEDRADGVIDGKFFERKFAEYSEEEEILEQTLSNLTNHNNEYLQLGILIHELAFQARAIYQAASPDEKRLLLKSFFADLIQDRYTVTPVFTLAGQYLEDWMPRLNRDYELVKSKVNQGENGDFQAAHSALLHLNHGLRTIPWKTMFPYPDVALGQIKKLLAVCGYTGEEKIFLQISHVA